MVLVCAISSGSSNDMASSSIDFHSSSSEVEFDLQQFLAYMIAGDAAGICKLPLVLDHLTFQGFCCCFTVSPW
jgi:hypothetical protein